MFLESIISGGGGDRAGATLGLFPLDPLLYCENLSSMTEQFIS
jgi:hypothetical protein